MISKLFLVITAVVVAVIAQGNSTSTSTAATPSGSTSSPDACTLECLTSAATVDGCGSYTNLTCVCTNSQFQVDAAYCIALNCPAADSQIAVALQFAECSPLGLSATGPTAMPTIIPFTLSGTAGASGSATSSSPTSRTTSSSASAGSLVANGGVAAIMAMVAGFLAI